MFERELVAMNYNFTQRGWASTTLCTGILCCNINVLGSNPLPRNFRRHYTDAKGLSDPLALSNSLVVYSWIMLCSTAVPHALIECRISSAKSSSVSKMSCVFFTSITSSFVTDVSLKLKLLHFFSKSCASGVDLNDALLVLDWNDPIERLSSTAIKSDPVVSIGMLSQ